MLVPRNLKYMGPSLNSCRFSENSRKSSYKSRIAATIHGKTTYEWHTDDIRIHTSDIRMTYEYIPVTYGWHIRVHTSDIRMTCDWHTDDMQFIFERKIKFSFVKRFDNSLSKHLIYERTPCMQSLFCVIYQN